MGVASEVDSHAFDGVAGCIAVKVDEGVTCGLIVLDVSGIGFS